jgi:hypothetical protein
MKVNVVELYFNLIYIGLGNTEIKYTKRIIDQSSK